MKAMVLPAFDRPFELRELPDPEPGYGEVVLQVEACGVCHTDLKIRAGTHPNCKDTTFPHIHGHEICGHVIKIGDGVTGWRNGDRAIVDIYYGCGECRNCLSGNTQRCEGELRVVGYSVPGGFAEQVCIRAANLVRVSADLPAEYAAVTTDAIATSYRAAYTAGQIRAGQTALVVGFGGLGAHLAQILKAEGLSVTICDTSGKKLSIAPELGFSDTFCGLIQNMPEHEPFDVVFDVTGVITDYDILLRLVAKGGRFVMVGYTTKMQSSFSSAIAHVGELTMCGTRGYTMEDLAGALAMVEDGKVRPVIGKILPLTDANEALRMLEEGFDECGRIVLVP